jgi:hypothetical protein
MGKRSTADGSASIGPRRKSAAEAAQDGRAVAQDDRGPKVIVIEIAVGRPADHVPVVDETSVVEVLLQVVLPLQLPVAIVVLVIEIAMLAVVVVARVALVVAVVVASSTMTGEAVAIVIAIVVAEPQARAPRVLAVADAEAVVVAAAVRITMGRPVAASTISTTTGTRVDGSGRCWARCRIDAGLDTAIKSASRSGASVDACGRFVALS